MKSALARITEARQTVQNGRASEARPENEGVDQVTPKLEEGVSTAHNQSSTFWPGSVAPPQTLPPLGADFPATAVGQPAAAQTKMKSELGSPWSSSVPESHKKELGLAVPHLELIVTIVTPFASVVNYRYYRLEDMTEAPKEDDLNSL